ncbi:cytochrome P450 86B1 [Corchorus capsularis]|uniref:Cytochrome P450 86B1 n=1 Tax=Corchorus capsularis TaxID=210143 RepID=A0A1R3GQ08_COCAP|nr:cytochrome P450 86B1 [Corchorus capsularis]
MINPSNNLTSSSSSDVNVVAGNAANFGFRQMLLLQHFQILELILAFFVFIVIHSLRQKSRYGLPVWPFLGMLPSLVAGC